MCVLYLFVPSNQPRLTSPITPLPAGIGRRHVARHIPGGWPGGAARVFWRDGNRRGPAGPYCFDASGQPCVGCCGGHVDGVDGRHKAGHGGNEAYAVAAYHAQEGRPHRRASRVTADHAKPRSFSRD
jgi:hypothetical protein